MQNVFMTLLNTNHSSYTKSKSLSKSNYKSSNIYQIQALLEEKRNILDYMITESTEYVDLHKCQDFYIKSNYQLLAQSSDLFKTIKSKKEKLQALEKIIQKELINNMEIDICFVEDYYQNTINSLKKEIIMKKREISQYTSHVNEKIVNNNASKKILNNENSIEEINEKTSEKYKVIALNAKRSLKSQETNYNNLIEYEKNYKEHVEKEIEKKINTYNFLDYQVFKIKSNNVGLESMLENLKKKAKNANEKINLQKKKMKELINEIHIIKHNLLVDNVIINKICWGFKVKSIYDVIKLYNNDKVIRDDNCTQFKIINASILEYQNELKQLKLKKQTILDCNTNHISNKTNEDNLEYQEYESFTSLERYVTLIKQFIGFLDGSNKRMIKLINCIKTKKTQIKGKNVSLEKLFNNLNLIDFSTVKLILKMLMDFIYNFNFLNYHFLSYLSLNNQFNRIKMNCSVKNLILDLNSHTIQSLMDDQTKTALYRLEKKNKLLARTEEEIFQLNQTISQEERKKKDIVKKEKTIDNIFQNYIDHLNKVGNSDYRKENNLDLQKPKIVKHISKFTNEFVIGLGEKNLCKKMIKHNKKNDNNTEHEIFNVFKEKSIKKALFKKFKSFVNESKNQDDFDNQRVNTDYNISKSIRKNDRKFHSISRKQDLMHLENTLIRIKNDPPINDSNSISIKLKNLNKKSLDNKENKKVVSTYNKRDFKLESDKKYNQTKNSLLSKSKFGSLNDVLESRILVKKPLNLKYNSRKINYLNDLFDDKFLENTNKEIEVLKTSSSYLGFKNQLNYSTDIQSIKTLNNNLNGTFKNFKQH